MEFLYSIREKIGFVRFQKQLCNVNKRTLKMADASQSSISPFEPGEMSTVSARWKKWKRSFQIFLEVNNVTIASRKRSYLLHCVGPQVQDVFFSLQGEDAPEVPTGSDEYKEAVKLLDDYFLPMKCLPLERHKFRNIEQANDEPIERFVLRLREQGNLCEYGDHLDEEIKEQLFERGASDDLREKILNKPAMTLAETIETGRSLETIGKHRQSSKLIPRQEELNRIAQMANGSKNNVRRECRRCGRSERFSNDEGNSGRRECYRCGRTGRFANDDNYSGRRECYRCGRIGHFANDDNCPALDRKCERCGLVGHFKKRCNTKQRKKKVSEKRLRQVKANDSDDSDDREEDSEESDDSVQYLFATEPERGEKVVCAVGGVKVSWVVDSGAGVNVINRQTWEYLKEHKVHVNHQTTDVKKSLKAYGGHSIRVAGMFSTVVATKKEVIEAEIYVVENGSCCLLGRKTAKALGILNINSEVWTVNDNDVSCIGRIVRVNPIQKAPCQIPIQRREKTVQENQMLLKQAEEIPWSSPWISSFVVQPKAVLERRKSYGVTLNKRKWEIEKKDMVWGERERGDRMVVPVDLRRRLLQLSYIGHPGIETDWRDIHKEMSCVYPFTPRPTAGCCSAEPAVIRKEGDGVPLETPEVVQCRISLSHAKRIPRSLEERGSEEETQYEGYARAIPQVSVPVSAVAEKLQPVAEPGSQQLIRRPLKYIDYVMDLNADGQ